MPSKDLRDNVSRGKVPSPIGKSIFVGLRAADVVWQYNLLYRNWGIQFIQKLGWHAVPSTQVLNPLHFSKLQHYYGLVSLLSLGSSLKQILHIIQVSEQEMSAGSGIMIAAFNTVFNTVNTLLSLWMVSSPALHGFSSFSDILSSPTVAIGLACYIIGLLTETISEFQRKAFKQDPSNARKPYGGGLFSLATNINYGGYTLWRAAYATVCGGVVWGATTFAFFFHDFATRGVPVMDQYLTQRYGDTYQKIKASVKYSLIPGIY